MIEFTKYTDGSIYGYDQDDASQALALSRIENDGHVQHELIPPTASDLLDSGKVSQAALAKTACASAITNGFTSSALGATYTYPSSQTDQTNLAASVLHSLFPDLASDWTTLQICCDSAGVWEYRPHTAAQIQQVGTDMKDGILALLVKNAGLQSQISLAATIEDVQAVTW